MKDRVGEKYGRLEIISFDRRAGENRKKYQYYWNCKCDCGTIKSICYGNLQSKTTKSCGCFKAEALGKFSTVHGRMKNSRKFKNEFSSWHNMIDRCTDPLNSRYYLYGGKGITICNSWLESFDNFVKDMGLKPEKHYSIERINGEEGYNKENCKWATPKEQAINRRSSSSVIDTITGKEYPTISDAAIHIKMNKGTLHSKLTGKSPNKTNLKLK